jgi:predicted methyltransferase
VEHCCRCCGTNGCSVLHGGRYADLGNSFESAVAKSRAISERKSTFSRYVEPDGASLRVAVQDRRGCTVV